MSTEFIQKKGYNIRKFILTSDKIIVETKTIQKKYKYEVKLDRLGLDIHYQADNTIAGKIFFTICLILIAISVFAFFYNSDKEQNIWIFNTLLWTAMAFFAYFKQHQDDIFLVGGESNLAFYRNIPNEEKVLEFINKIKTSTKIYLKEKYTYFDKNTSDQDFFHRINWLYEKEIITYTEYLDYKTNFETQKLL